MLSMDTQMEEKEEGLLENSFGKPREPEVSCLAKLVFHKSLLFGSRLGSSVG